MRFIAGTASQAPAAERSEFAPACYRSFAVDRFKLTDVGKAIAAIGAVWILGAAFFVANCAGG